MTKELTHTLKPYLDAIEHLTNGSLFYLNPETKTIVHSSKIFKKLGLPTQVSDFPNCFFPLIHPEDVSGFEKYAEKMCQGTTSTHYFRYPEGDHYHYARLTSSPILDDNGDTTEILGRMERIDFEIALQQRATLDPLTQTLSSDFWQEYVDAVLSVSDEKTFHALFLIQLNDLKELQEKKGEEFSHFILAELGNRMVGNVREKDLIGRIEEDKFVLLIRNVPNFDIIKKKSKQLLGSITTEFKNESSSATITGAIGISVFPEHGKSYSSLISCSEKSLKRSQERGENISTVYKEEHK